MGIDIGIVDWNVFMNAPRQAFGTGRGSGDINFNINSENYFYNSLSTALIYTFNIERFIIKSEIGPSLRFYHQETDPDVTGAAFNRSAPYDPYDPNSGPPDLLINIPPVGNRLHLNISAGIGIEKRVTSQSNLVFGIRKNWGMQPIGKGSTLVQMYNQFYEGEFSPKSSFFGIDVRYVYSLDRKQNSDILQSQNAIDKSGYKKAIFFELLGNGVVASFNYDIRLKKDRNDGFGLRAGIGKGEFYPTETATNTGRFTTLPLSINYIVGNRRSGLETGIGITPRFTFDQVSEYSNVRVGGFLNVGYRYQPMKEGLVFRAALTPFVGGRPILQRWAGASIGYGFK